MQTIGQRVKKVREAQKLSQPELAKRVGRISYQTIQQLESGDSKSSKYLLGIARALGVRPEWLESGSGAMRESGEEWEGAALAVRKPADELIEIDGTEFARLAVYDIRFAAGASSSNY